MVNPIGPQDIPSLPKIKKDLPKKNQMLEAIEKKAKERFQQEFERLKRSLPKKDE